VSGANTALVGESWAETVLDFGGTTGYLLINAERCTLANLKLTGSQNTSYGALRVNGAYATVCGCLFDANYRHVWGDAAWASQQLVLLRNELRYASGQMAALNGICPRVVGNLITGTAVVRDFLLSGSTPLIASNTIWYATIVVQNIHAILSGNSFLWGRVSLSAYGDQASIVGNNFSSPQGNAIEVPSQLSRVVGNAIYQPTGRGVYVTGSRNTVAANTIVGAAGGSGIAVTGNRNIVQGNQMHDGAQYGLHVTTGATNNIVANNVALGNVSGQILDEGTGTVLDNNVTS
jgi:hypothetical protein